jgi:hypothetical protein
MTPERKLLSDVLNAGTIAMQSTAHLKALVATAGPETRRLAKAVLKARLIVGKP